MLATHPSTVSEAIIALFRKNRELTAQQILHQIRKEFFSCSQRAVYKELSRLVRQGVVVQLKKHFSLSISWIVTLIGLSEQLYTTSVKSVPLVTILPEPGEKQQWYFNDLAHLDRFWLQLIFLLFEHSKSRTMFTWVPYFWFDLIHLAKDIEAQDAMKISGNRMYMILGSETFLDTLPTKYWSRDVYIWSYAESPFHAHYNRYEYVIDDWVLTVTLSQETTTRIHNLFHAIKTKNDLYRVREFDSIQREGKAKLQIERNHAKASKLHKVFKEYFGLK